VDLIEFKLWSKPDALDKLARILQLFKDVVQVEGKDGGPIQITAVEVVKPAAG